jgi:hypothetical protein
MAALNWEWVTKVFVVADDVGAGENSDVAWNAGEIGEGEDCADLTNGDCVAWS